MVGSVVVEVVEAVVTEVAVVPAVEDSEDPPLKMTLSRVCLNMTSSDFARFSSEPSSRSLTGPPTRSCRSVDSA